MPMLNSLQSLRFRLLLTMSIAVLVAVGVIAAFASRSTRDEFTRYLNSDIQRNRQLVYSFLSSYGGIKSMPGRADLSTLVKKLAQSSSDRFIVTNGSGLVLADSDGTLEGKSVEWPGPVPLGMFSSEPGGAGPGANVPITGSTGVGIGAGAAPYSTGFVPFAMIPYNSSPGPSPGGGSQAAPSQIAGEILIVARAAPNGNNPNQNGFLNSVNQQLALAALIGGVAALLLSWLLSRRILKQIYALTAAAGRMEKGDLSQRVAATSNDEIGKLARAFNSMTEGLSRLEQARRNMVTDVAHELRTPISNIQGYLEAMRDGLVKPDQAVIESLHEEAVLLGHLVEDLRELELAEAGKLRLVRQRIDLDELIAKAVAASQPAAGNKKIALRTELAEGLPSVEADPERIRQIVRNLLTNAIGHTPRHGSIEVTAQHKGGEIEVSVRDTGPGIPSEHLPYVFDRFYRVDQSRTRSTGGAGLGLAIVRQLVEVHGGRVGVESTPGQGASFYFTLPISC